MFCISCVYVSSAWVRAENLCPYLEHKERLSKAAKGQKFKKAMDAIEEAITEDANKVRFILFVFIYLIIHIFVYIFIFTVLLKI